MFLPLPGIACSGAIGTTTAISEIASCPAAGLYLGPCLQGSICIRAYILCCSWKMSKEAMVTAIKTRERPSGPPFVGALNRQPQFLRSHIAHCSPVTSAYLPYLLRYALLLCTALAQAGISCHHAMLLLC